MTSAPTITTILETPENAEHVQAVYLAIFVCVLALVVGLLAAYGLRRLRVHFLSEASVLLVVGVLVGALIHLDHGAHVIAGVERITLFDGEVLFVLLLPPIIFESGFRSSLDSFFSNIGGICLLAFLGTFLSSAVTGLLVFSGGRLGWVYQTSAVEAMAFGSLISATDPVTILSTLQSLGVDPTLYSLVFGESVLNDAVAIALFNSVVNFEEEPVSLTLVLRGAARFLEIFLGSLGIGILLGCLTAFLLQRCGGMRAAVDKPGFDLNSISSGDGETVSIDGDSDNIGGVVDDGGGDGGVSSSSASRIRNVNDHRRLGHHDVDGSAVHVNTETQVREQVTVLALIPYLSYCLAEYLQLSGIVSILFCGFAMSKYAKQYMGKEAEHALGETFHTLAHVAESFIFIYLGMAVFTSGDEVWDQFGFVMYSLLVVLVTRFIVVVPLMLFYNMFRSPADKLGFNKIFVLWLAGLRGAIAFALAAQSPYRLKNTLTGQVFKTATMFIAYVTVVLIGGVMPWVTMRLGLATNDDAASNELRPRRHNRSRTNSSSSSSSRPLYFDARPVEVSSDDDGGVGFVRHDAILPPSHAGGQEVQIELTPLSREDSGHATTSSTRPKHERQDNNDNYDSTAGTSGDGNNETLRNRRAAGGHSVGAGNAVSPLDDTVASRDDDAHSNGGFSDIVLQ